MCLGFRCVTHAYIGYVHTYTTGINKERRTRCPDTCSHRCHFDIGAVVEIEHLVHRCQYAHGHTHTQINSRYSAHDLSLQCPCKLLGAVRMCHSLSLTLSHTLSHKCHQPTQTRTTCAPQSQCPCPRAAACTRRSCSVSSPSPFLNSDRY